MSCESGCPRPTGSMLWDCRARESLANFLLMTYSMGGSGCFVASRQPPPGPFPPRFCIGTNDNGLFLFTCRKVIQRFLLVANYFFHNLAGLLYLLICFWVSPNLVWHSPKSSILSYTQYHTEPPISVLTPFHVIRKCHGA